MSLRKWASRYPAFTTCLKFTAATLIFSSTGMALVSEVSIRSNGLWTDRPDYTSGITARFQYPLINAMSLLRNIDGHEVPVGSGLHEEAACFDELKRSAGVENEELDRLRKSSLFLLAEYENGTLQQGSGTIIRGRIGLARVLTAAHVAPPEIKTEGGTSRLRRIIAFDAEGSRAADLGLAFSGAPDQGVTKDGFRASADIAVLNVMSLTGEDTPTDWNARALPLAQQQSTRFSLLFQNPGTAVVNQGMSGGAMLTPELEVAGVIIQTMMRKEDRAQGPTSPFASAILAGGDIEHEDLLALMKTRLESPGKVGAGLALALPVAHPEIIDALGINSDRITLKASDTSRRIIVGYPASDCRATEVRTLEPGLLRIPPLDRGWVLDAETDMMMAMMANRRD